MAETKGVPTRIREAASAINDLLDAQNVEPVDAVIALALVLGPLVATGRHQGLFTQDALEAALGEVRHQHDECRKFLQLRFASAGGHA